MKAILNIRFFLLFYCSMVGSVGAASIDGLRNAIIQRFGQEKIDLFKQCEGIRTKFEYLRTTEEKTQLINMETMFTQDRSLALSMHINKFLSALPLLKFSSSLISNILNELSPQCQRLGITSGFTGNVGYLNNNYANNNYGQ